MNCAATLSHDSTNVLTGEALRVIMAERISQIDDHGRTIALDVAHNDPEDLPLAAASYVNAAIDQLTTIRPSDVDLAKPDPMTWPWDDEHWRPRDPRTNLVKAAALIWAAIDRLDHAPRDAGDVVSVDVEADRTAA